MNDEEANDCDSVNDRKINNDLIKRIKEIQDLPEEVIYKFISAAGSLSNTYFVKRFDNAK